MSTVKYIPMSHKYDEHAVHDSENNHRTLTVKPRFEHRTHKLRSRHRDGHHMYTRASKYVLNSVDTSKQL